MTSFFQGLKIRYRKIYCPVGLLPGRKQFMHPNAKTNKVTRSYIQSSNKTVNDLARELNVSGNTIRKWKRRSSPEDLPHIPKNLHTTLNSSEEIFLMFLRGQLGLSIDDMLIVAKKFISSPVSRSGLGRLIQRKHKKHIGIVSDPRRKDNLVKLYICKLSEHNIYLIVSTYASKMIRIINIKGIDNSEFSRLVEEVLIEYNVKKICVCEGSFNFGDYLRKLQVICFPRNILILRYAEDPFFTLNKIEIDKIITDPSRIKEKIRAFQYIYNYRTRLRSLKNNTPASSALSYAFNDT